MDDKLYAITKYVEFPTDITPYDNTIKENEFKVLFPEIKFNLMNIDPKTVTKLSEVFSDIMEKYMIKLLGYVGIDDFPYTKLDEDTIGTVKRLSDGRYAIILNMNWHNNIFNTMRLVEFNQRNLNWAGNKQSPLYIFYHEIGHLLDKQYNLQNDKIILDIFYEERENVSGYGATAYADFIAESVAYGEIMSMRNDYTVAMRVYNRINEIISNTKEGL